MKALILTAGLALSSMAVSAEEFNCSAFASLAETIMTARQIPLPLDQVKDLVATDEADPEIKKLISSVIDMAYSIDLVYGESNKKTIGVEFRSATYKLCIAGRDKSSI